MIIPISARLSLWKIRSLEEDKMVFTIGRLMCAYDEDWTLLSVPYFNCIFLN